jgi:hypothetical protein
MSNIKNEYHEACRLEPHVPSDEIIRRLAAKHKTTLAQVKTVCDFSNYLTMNDWPDTTVDVSDLTLNNYTQVNIVPKNTLGKFVKSVAASVQFPVNTACLHAFTCVASAMVRNFTFSVYGDKKSPVTLYTVSAQPPSTGKSGIHDYFCSPIREHYGLVNQQIKEDRKRLKVEIKSIQNKIKSTKNPHEQASMEVEIEELEQQLSGMGDIIHSTDDTTPEALEALASRQGNWFNALSPEADILNTLVGGSYGGDSRKVNHGLILKAWDGEYFSSARVTRTTTAGFYRGCMGVLAQDEGVKSILKAGESGRGLSERVLIMRERPLLGQRDMMGYTPVDQELKQWYSDLCKNLVESGEVNFTFCDKAKTLVNEYRAEIERKLSNKGIYSSNLLRGFCGKAGSQIYRIACIIHASENWCIGGSKSKKVNAKTTQDAILIFNEIKECYVDAVASEGYAGNTALLVSTAEALKDATGMNGGKRKTEVSPTGQHQLRLSTFRTWKRNTNPFRDQSDFIEIVKDDIIPILVQEGYCSFDGNKIYISPKIL